VCLACETPLVGGDRSIKIAGRLMRSTSFEHRPDGNRVATMQTSHLEQQ
jgi:hypothetical protein